MPDGSGPDGADASDAGTRDQAAEVASEGGPDAGVDSGLDSGQEAGGNACSTPDVQIPGLRVDTIGPPGGTYEGPAIVERSSATELVMAFTPTDARDAGATSALPLHARIHGLSPMPAFPLGARVWLSKSPAGDPPFSFFGPASWSIAVRDKQGGRLLFGAAKEPAKAAFAPLSFDNVRAVCSGAYSDSCASGSVTHSSVEVHGDTAVVITDGQTRAVRAGGVDYDVTVMARDITTTNVRCADYYAYDGLAVDVRARDLGPLVAGLEVGAPIACPRGNEDLKEVGFSFYEVPLSTPYDGRAFYLKRRPDTAYECFQFKPVGVMGAAPGDTPVLEFCTSPGLFREPAPNQEFWVTTTSFRLAALRGPNRGSLLLAFVYADAPLDAPTSAQLESVLGVHLEARELCRYADGDPTRGAPVSPLWELAFGRTSPVALRTDGHAVVPIAGKDYDAWMWAQGPSLGLSLAAR